MARINFGFKLIEATLIKRVNRFSALVEFDTQEHLAYVANSGRMKELFLPGAKVLLREQKDPNRKTKFDLLCVSKGEVLISIDSRIPNMLLEQAVLEGLEDFPNVLNVRREVTIGKSRLDFVLTLKQGELCYIEAKSVTLVENQIARFPDAPTERGSKHLLELIGLVDQGHRAAIVFIIQRPDATSFRPNAVTDPHFAHNLKAAKDAGVEIYAYSCLVDNKGIAIFNKIAVEVKV